jgi:hypothetical protein
MANLSKRDIRHEVAYLVMENPKWSRAKIYGEICGVYGETPVKEVVKERAVGNWIKSVRDVTDYTVWKPWGEEVTGRANTSFLLTLQVVSQLLMQRDLFLREAVWAARLEQDLVDLDPIAQFFIVNEYSSRAVLATVNGTVIQTGDLDTLLVLKPWTQVGKKRYAQAFEIGAAVPPRLRLMMVPPRDPNQQQLYLSARGCQKLGVPFDVIQATAHSAIPETFVYAQAPGEQEKHLLDADWYDVLMEYWKFVISTATSGRSHQEDDNG